jgi:hypothetical protein
MKLPRHDRCGEMGYRPCVARADCQLGGSPRDDLKAVLTGRFPSSVLAESGNERSEFLRCKLTVEQYSNGGKSVL